LNGAASYGSRITAFRESQVYELTCSLTRASFEDLNQQRIGLIAYPERIAFARSGDVEGLNLQSAQPAADRRGRFWVSGIEDEQGASEAGCTPCCPIGPQILIRGSRPQDQRRVGVTGVPFRPLRTRNVGRMRAPVLRGFLKWKACRNDPRFTFTAGRAPPAAIQTAILCRPESRLVDPGLTAGDYLPQKHRLKADLRALLAFFAILEPLDLSPDRIEVQDEAVAAGNLDLAFHST
jgi:hypothetical protein